MEKLSNTKQGDYACSPSAAIHQPKETSWHWARNALRDGMLLKEFLHFQTQVKDLYLLLFSYCSKL